jgi:hypothetical protein
MRGAAGVFWTGWHSVTRRHSTSSDMRHPIVIDQANAGQMEHAHTDDSLTLQANGVSK